MWCQFRKKTKKKLSTGKKGQKELILRPMTMETQCCKKVWISKMPAIRFMCRSLWAQIFKKQSSKLEKNNEKNNSWADVGPRSAWEKLSQMLIRSDEIPSPRQTSIDKINDCAMKSERGALVRGSDPPSGHLVHKTTGGDTWRAPARCLIQTHLGAAV